MILLNVYLDRGAKPQGDRIMNVCAAIFKPSPYRLFLCEWKPFLQRWRAPAFHATDFYNGVEEFWRKYPDGTAHSARQIMFEKDCRLIPKILGNRVKKFS